MKTIEFHSKDIRDKAMLVIAKEIDNTQWMEDYQDMTVSFFNDFYFNETVKILSRLNINYNPLKPYSLTDYYVY